MAAKRAEEDAAARATAPSAADDVPDALYAVPSRRIGRKLALGLGLLLLLMWIGVNRRPKPPFLEVSCTTPAFALSTHEVEFAHPVTYTVVGPEAEKLVIGVDTQTFRHLDGAGGYEPVPLPGTDPRPIIAAGHLSREEGHPMKGCRRSGVFALPITPGPHVVILYELTPTGATEVARQDVTVTPSDN
ncbi:MAG TPA: hypothetical protein VFQ85_08130 [Mycobacteriales bacterium]|jgi:hypothetical protein|nr:hypothetical protein [Mycobacteriales bacterium]